MGANPGTQGARQVFGTVTVDEVTGTITITSATLATQATLAELLTELQLKADLAETQPVSAVSLPLPAGAATSALQLPDGHNVTVDNASAGSAVNIQDGGNAITVDWAGTAPPIGGGTEATALKVTIASDSTGVLSVDDNGGSLTVDSANVNPATAYGKTITYVAVAQGAAGTTELAAASASNKHKIIGGMLTMSLAGTLKFNDGTVDLTGPMNFAANGGMVVPESPVPFCQTAAVNRPMNLITTLGNANGVIAILTEA